jgi:Tfp pilus assembly protein PilE
MKSQKTLITSIVVVVIVAVAVIIAVLVANHNNSNNTNTNSAKLTNYKQAIESNWKTFFAYNTPMSQRVKLLQNGSNFASALQMEFAGIGSQHPTATVNSVKLNNNNTQADVNYVVNLGGHPVLTNQQGTAVLVGKNWQVSDSTLCGLLKMAGQTPAVCQKL